MSNVNRNILVSIFIIILLVNPVYAYHTIHADEFDFIVQDDPDNNVGYLNIVNGSSAYLHNTYGTNATNLLGNVTADTDTDIITTHAFIDNDLEETDSTEIYNDNETFWTAGGTAVLTEELTIVKKGSSSLKLVTSGGAGNAYHSYGGDQDWSSGEYVAWYIYGANTNNLFVLEIWANDGSNRFDYFFNDNFIGWKRFVIPMEDFTEVGSPDWAMVEYINYYSYASGTVYIDNMVFDVGQWVSVEISIPDALDGLVQNVKLYSWDSGAYDASTFMRWDSENDSPGETWTAANLYFLDGSVSSDIYSGDIWEYIDSYLNGERGTTRDSVHVSSSNIIVYSYLYGVVNRVGFAIKMPPDDGQDSVDGGISQVRFKAEILYDDDGATTIVHRGLADEPEPGYGGSIGIITAVVIGFSALLVVGVRKR